MILELPRTKWYKKFGGHIRPPPPQFSHPFHLRLCLESRASLCTNTDALIIANCCFTSIAASLAGPVASVQGSAPVQSSGAILLLESAKDAPVIGIAVLFVRVMLSGLARHVEQALSASASTRNGRSLGSSGCCARLRPPSGGGGRRGCRTGPPG